MSALCSGPRLNAAGRLDSAEAALNLLLEQDVMQAGITGPETGLPKPRAPGSHPPDAGSGRLDGRGSPEWRRSSLPFRANSTRAWWGWLLRAWWTRITARRSSARSKEEFTRASCRRIPEFHITQALDECKDLLVRHGGHAVAAGFTVRNENLPELMARLGNAAREQLGGLELAPSLRVDVELAPHELHPDLLKYLDLLQPTGQENPDAVFVSRNLRVVDARTVGGEGQHLKMKLTDGWMTWDAIAFRQGHWLESMPQRVDVALQF